jgi:hypothetical protein
MMGCSSSFPTNEINFNDFYYEKEATNNLGFQYQLKNKHKCNLIYA